MTDAADGFRRLIAVATLEPGEMRSCEANGRAVVVCRVGDDYYAVEDQCSHARATLHDGQLHGFELVCPLHGARFDVRDGACRAEPARRAIEAFPTRVVDGQVEARVSAAQPAKKRFGPLY